MNNNQNMPTNNINKANNIIAAVEEKIKTSQFKNKEELVQYLTNLKNDEKNKNIIDAEEARLLETYDEMQSPSMTPTINPGTNFEILMMQLEEKVRTNQFNSKEALLSHINNLKRQGVPENILSEEKVVELLNLYDELNMSEEDKLNLENYSGISLGEKNMIVSKQDDIILKTDRPSEEMPQEFKEHQNELSAMGNDGLANADAAFEHMKNYEKEQMNLIPLSDAVKKDNVNAETLMKIKFFVTNKYINPFEYKIDLDNVIFYNTATQELLEVRKNEETNQYAIYKGSEVVYSEAPPTNENEDEAENELEKDTEEEKMAYENKNVKVRRLIKPKDISLNNNARIQSSMLFIMSVFTALIGTVILLILK